MGIIWYGRRWHSYRFQIRKCYHTTQSWSSCVTRIPGPSTECPAQTRLHTALSIVLFSCCFAFSPSFAIRGHNHICSFSVFHADPLSRLQILSSSMSVPGFTLVIKDCKNTYILLEVFPSIPYPYSFWCHIFIVLSIRLFFNYIVINVMMWTFKDCHRMFAPWAYWFVYVSMSLSAHWLPSSIQSHVPALLRVRISHLDSNKDREGNLHVGRRLPKASSSKLTILGKAISSAFHYFTIPSGQSATWVNWTGDRMHTFLMNSLQTFQIAPRQLINTRI